MVTQRDADHLWIEKEHVLVVLRRLRDLPVAAYRDG